MHCRPWKLVLPLLAATIAIAFVDRTAAAGSVPLEALGDLRSRQDDPHAQVHLARSSSQWRQRRAQPQRQALALRQAQAARRSKVARKVLVARQSLASRRAQVRAAKQARLSARQTRAGAKRARAETRRLAQAQAAAKRTARAGARDGRLAEKSAATQPQTFYNQMGPTGTPTATAQAPPAGQQQGRPDRGNASREDREKWIGEIARVLKRLRPSVDDASIRSAAERALKIPDADYVALLTAKLGDLRQGQRLGDAVAATDQIWAREREAERQRAQWEQDEKARKQREAERKSRRDEIERLKEEQKRLATQESRSRTYDQELEKWVDRRSQWLPDGKWGLASEYNKALADDYYNRTKVNLEQAWEDDENRKKLGLPPLPRPTPLPAKVAYKPQSDRYKMSDPLPPKPTDYVPK
jgi:hypothetical protein